MTKCAGGHVHLYLDVVCIWKTVSMEENHLATDVCFKSRGISAITFMRRKEG